MLWMYFTGWFVTTVGVLVGCLELPGMRDARLLESALLAMAAGALWPVLVIGVLQLIAIVVVAKVASAYCSRQHDEGSMPRDERRLPFSYSGH